MIGRKEGRKEGSEDLPLRFQVKFAKETTKSVYFNWKKQYGDLSFLLPDIILFRKTGVIASGKQENGMSSVGWRVCYWWFLVCLKLLVA